MDPYEILGVSRSASDEDIKEAYRRLLAKYHPDNYAGNPLSELAEEKMHEINDAYDKVMAERRGYSYTSAGSSGSSAAYSGDSHMEAAREYVRKKRYADAENELSMCAVKDAEWYYLIGCVYEGRGWFDAASRSYQTAMEMAPGNKEYAFKYNKLKGTERRVNNNNTVYTSSHSGCCSGDACNICTCLYCSDCCCESMGGDLISCC